MGMKSRAVMESKLQFHREVSDDELVRMSLMEEAYKKTWGVRSAKAPIVLESGAIGLDLSLGGGFTSGAVEIFGEPGSGKTTLLGCLIRQAVKKDMGVAWSPEYQDPKHLENMGVTLDKVYEIRASCLEALLEATSDLLCNVDNIFVAIDPITIHRPRDDESQGRWDGPAPAGRRERRCAAESMPSTDGLAREAIRRPGCTDSLGDDRPNEPTLRRSRR